MARRATRVYLVEDHPVMRRMLCEAVGRLPGCVLAGASESAETALAELVGVQTDLVLIDVSLPQMNGVDLVRTLRRRMPGLTCMMVSGHHETSYAISALRAGASGYVLKDRPDDLAAGIRTISAGGRFVSEPLGRRLERDG